MISLSNYVSLSFMLFCSSLSTLSIEGFSVLPTTNNVSGGAASWVSSSDQRISMNRSSPLFSTVMPDVPTAPTTITVEPVVEDEVIGTRPRIVSIESAEDYLNFLQEGQDEDEERLAVVKFYADWCKSCQKFGQQFNRVGREIGDLEEVTLNQDDDEAAASVVRQGEIRMGEIEWSSNSELCKSLGITKLPAVHIYSSKGRLVDAFRCGPNKLSMFLDKLDNYMSMDPAELEFEADMTEGARLSANVVDALNEEILSSSSITSAPASPLAGAAL